MPVLSRIAVPLMLMVAFAGCEKQEEAEAPPAVQGTGITADPEHEASVDVAAHELKVGDSVLSVQADGTAAPGAVIDIHVTHVSGPKPEAIRMWYGPRSGEGAMKIKAHTHGDVWHGHADCPGTLTSQDMLWIEMEDAEGNRTATGMKVH